MYLASEWAFKWTSFSNFLLLYVTIQAKENVTITLYLLPSDETVLCLFWDQIYLNGMNLGGFQMVSNSLGDIKS